MPTELLRLTFPDLGALEREIATNIRYGRVFVGEVLDAPVLTEGVIVLVHPQTGRELSLGAQVVMVNYDGPMRGTGIALRSFGPPDVERVQAFVGAADPTDAAPAPAAEPRIRQTTPAPMAAADAVSEQPPRQTPVPTPTPRSERPRQQTPIPMPTTLSDRPRRATPNPRTEAVTVRPAMTPGAGGTVPPSAPENDWSDLQSSGLVHDAARAMEAASRSDRGSDDEDTHAHGDQDEDAHADVDAAPELSASQSDAAGETAATHAAAADDDWSDVAAAIEEPVAAEAATDDDWSDVAAAIEEPVAVASDAEGAFDDQTDADARETESESEPEGDGEDTGSLDEDSARPAATELQQENRQHRLRTLNAVEQLKVARRGELSERVVVERLYGKQVWEALLQNPRLTLPEVARIARKGTVPRPLIEQILENQMWAKAPNVQRALLSNPKLTPEGVVKLLKMMPKHELKIMEKATAYPIAVRDAARKMLRDSK